MLFSFEQQRTYTQLFHLFQMTIPPSLSLILISNRGRASLKIIYGVAFHQRRQCLIQASLTKSNKEEGNFLEYEVCIVIGGLIGILDLVELEDKYDF